jgi:hypothetical protein
VRGKPRPRSYGVSGRLLPRPRNQQPATSLTTLPRHLGSPQPQDETERMKDRDSPSRPQSRAPNIHLSNAGDRGGLSLPAARFFLPGLDMGAIYHVDECSPWWMDDTGHWKTTFTPLGQFELRSSGQHSISPSFSCAS